jgi:hypothetical protein
VEVGSKCDTAMHFVMHLINKTIAKMLDFVLETFGQLFAQLYSQCHSRPISSCAVQTSVLQMHACVLSGVKKKHIRNDKIAQLLDRTLNLFDLISTDSSTKARKGRLWRRLSDSACSIRRTTPTTSTSPGGGSP